MYGIVPSPPEGSAEAAAASSRTQATGDCEEV